MRQRPIPLGKEGHAQEVINARRGILVHHPAPVYCQTMIGLYQQCREALAFWQAQATPRSLPANNCVAESHAVFATRKQEPHCSCTHGLEKLLSPVVLSVPHTYNCMQGLRKWLTAPRCQCEVVNNMVQQTHGEF